MIKRRIGKDGRLLAAYSDSIIVPQPFVTLTEEENNKIAADDKHIYFYIDNNLVKKDKAEIEKREKRIEQIKEELNQLDLKTIRALRSNDTEYIASYENEAITLRTELQKLEKGE